MLVRPISHRFRTNHADSHQITYCKTRTEGPPTTSSGRPGPTSLPRRLALPLATTFLSSSRAHTLRIQRTTNQSPFDQIQTPRLGMPLRSCSGLKSIASSRFGRGWERLAGLPWASSLVTCLELLLERMEGLAWEPFVTLKEKVRLICAVRVTGTDGCGSAVYEVFSTLNAGRKFSLSKPVILLDSRSERAQILKGLASKVLGSVRV
jgi:hypothetical protein